MFFKDFLARYRAGTLNESAAWRAYDFERCACAKHALKAIKVLGLRYAGELAMSQVAAQYGIKDQVEAQRILGMWWLLREVESGGRPQKLLKRAAEGRGELLP